MSPWPWLRRPRVWRIAVALAAVTGALLWLGDAWMRRGFTEYPMAAPRDIPAAVAAGPDGAIWFTIDFSDAIGVLRDGRVERIAKGQQNFEPLGLAVDGTGAAWYTDSPQRAIARVSRDGSVASYSVGTPVAKFGRLAAAPDGAIWFAEESAITRFKAGAFMRYENGSLAAGPFGVAVDAGRAVWASIPRANKLVRISPQGEIAEFDVPTRGARLGDVAVDRDGGVWFLEMQANKIGRLAAGRFTEYAVPTPSAGLAALALAPDGAVWFTELRAQRLGRLRDGVFAEFRVPRRGARPFGIAVDAANNVWYTDLDGWLGRLSAARAR